MTDLAEDKERHETKSMWTKRSAGQKPEDIKDPKEARDSPPSVESDLHPYTSLASAKQYNKLLEQYNKLLEHSIFLQQQGNAYEERLLVVEQERNRIAQEFERVKEETRHLQEENAALRERLSSQAPEPSPTGVVNVPSPAAPKTGLPRPLTPEYFEAGMGVALNTWWGSSDRSRGSLRNLLDGIGLPAKFCVLVDVASALQVAGWSGPYSFEPSDTDGGWLWCDSDGGTALVLPADADFFSTPCTQVVLRRIVEGCEELHNKPRFREARKACLLRRESNGGYKVLQKGCVWVEGLPEPPSPRLVLVPVADAQETVPLGPSVPPQNLLAIEFFKEEFDSILSEIKAVKDAIGKERPSAASLAGLLARVNELLAESRQTQKLIARLERTVVSKPTPEELAEPTQESQNEFSGTASEGWWDKAAFVRAYLQVDSSLPYLNRLESLRGALENTLSGIVFNISHLTRGQGDSFSVHQARIEGDGSIVCEQCGRNVGAAQFFVTAQPQPDEPLRFLLPPGPLHATGFPRGYALLLSPAPDLSRSFEIESVIQPGALVEDGRVARALKWVGPAP